MRNDVTIWLEQLASLHKSRMRKAATASGLQLVHLEILHYLSICNRFSNTARALSDYLGQTKGSISQSLKHVEETGLIERQPCTEDGRKTRLYLTSEGKKFLTRLNKKILPAFPQDDLIIETLKSLLRHWQCQSNHKSFGQCKSCRYNQILENNTFHCGLLDEPLSKTDTQKICQEHAFEDDASSRSYTAQPNECRPSTRTTLDTHKYK